MRKVLMLRLTPLFAMLVLPACVAGPVIATTPSACSGLIPDGWKAGVAGAPLPDGSTVGDWIAFGDAQTGRLDVANGRQADTLAIISRCEERDKAAVKKSTRGFFGRLFGFAGGRFALSPAEKG